MAESIARADPPAWVADVVTTRQLTKLAPVSLWRELVQRSTLKASRRHIGLVLSIHAHDARTDEMTHDDLAARTGHDHKTVSLAVRELEAAGWVEADRVSRRKAVRYLLTWPPESGNPPDTESGNPPGTESGNPTGTPPESGNRDGTESGADSSRVRESARDHMWRCADDESSPVGGDSESTGPPAGDDDRFHQALAELVDLIMATVTPRNPGAYRRKVKHSAIIEHGAELRRILSEHPTWSPAEIAEAAHGSAPPRGEDSAATEARRLDSARNHGAKVGALVDGDELADLLASEYPADDARRAAFLAGRAAARSGAAA